MKCRQCEEEKNENDFPKGRRICKGCAYEKYKAWAKENKDKILRASTKFRENNRELCRKRCLESYHKKPWKSKEWRERNSEKNKAYKQKYVEKNIEELRRRKNEKRRIDKIHATPQGKARKAVFQAILKKSLVRPEKCQMCNKECKPEAHHSDYEKPLEVIWVCKACHGAIHAELKRKIKNLLIQ